MSTHKMAILINNSLHMGKGKIAAQAAHAAVKACERAPAAYKRAWDQMGSPKVVLRAESAEALQAAVKQAAAAGLPASLIRDAGHTQVVAGSVTAAAIGPAPSDDVNRITGAMPLL